VDIELGAAISQYIYIYIFIIIIIILLEWMGPEGQCARKWNDIWLINEWIMNNDQCDWEYEDGNKVTMNTKLVDWKLENWEQEWNDIGIYQNLSCSVMVW